MYRKNNYNLDNYEMLQTEPMLGNNIKPGPIYMNKDGSILELDSIGGFTGFTRKVTVYGNSLYKVDYKDTNGEHHREGKVDTILFAKIKWLLARTSALKNSYKPDYYILDGLYFTLVTPTKTVELGTLIDNRENIPLEIYNIVYELNAF